MKKTISVLVILLTVASLVFAGGAKEDKAAAPAAAPAAEAAKPQKIELEPTDQWPTLNFLNFNVSKNLNETKEYADIEAATGVKANYELLPSENASEVLMLTLSMDNDYDAVVIKSASDFRTLMSAGALLPLNDVIDTYAPELWDLCSAEVWQGVSDEQGNVYALPATASVKYEISNNLTVRLDLAEAAGLGRELPKTAEEFYQYCKKLKEFYGDQYVIIAGPDNSALSISKCFMSAFGIWNDWMLYEGKVIYMTEHPNYPALVEYMNKLYREGLLDSEYAVNNQTKSNAKMSSGKSIITMNGRGSISSAYSSLHKNFPDVDLDDLGYIPFLYADNGETTVQLNDGYSIFTMIPKSAAKNAKYVVKYASLKVENQEYCFIGTEGVHFQWMEDGYPKPIQPAFTDERNQSNNFLIMKDNDLWELQFYARLRKTDSIWAMFEVCGIDFKNSCQDVYKDADFAYNNCPAFQQYNAKLQGDLKAFNIQLVTGVKTLESGLADFNKEFKVSGGEEVRAQLQAYIDAKN